MNPTLVFSMYIFKALVFAPYGHVENDNKLDQYAWIYALAATLFAAPLAGIIAR